ncbi:MAG: sugar ABC transporter ATP-binding protein [Phyllobacterium sp.]
MVVSPAIAAHGIVKSFGETRALRGADLVVAPGEVVALMGANGAGKSTLVKILSGSIQPDAGHVEIAGRTIILPTPHAAKKAGVATVHQATDMAGCAGLTVAENLVLEELASDGAMLATPRRIRKRAAEIAALLDLDLPLDEDFANLRPAEHQLIAIARAVAAKSSVLILDEPTSTLSQAEADRLFGIVERLSADGIAVLYISHRLADIARIAHRAVVLRGGTIVNEFRRPIDFKAAVSAMIGRSLDEARPSGAVDQSRPVALSLRNIRLLEGAPPINLDIRQGEIVAITGALGSGKSRLLKGLFGLEAFAEGDVLLDGRAWRSEGAAHSIANDVFMVAEDRWRSSLLPADIPGGTIAGTISLPHLPRWFRSGLLRRERENTVAADAIHRLGIRARGPADTLNQLSGGNQQKVVLARWQAAPCRLLLLDEPFQGVDVGARADLIAAIRNQQAQSATLIATSDPEEALEVADRIFVMQEHGLRDFTDDRDRQDQLSDAAATGHDQILERGA